MMLTLRELLALPLEAVTVTLTTLVPLVFQEWAMEAVPLTDEGSSLKNQEYDTAPCALVTFAPNTPDCPIEREVGPEIETLGFVGGGGAEEEIVIGMLEEMPLTVTFRLHPEAQVAFGVHETALFASAASPMCRFCVPVRSQAAGGWGEIRMFSLSFRL